MVLFLVLSFVKAQVNLKWHELIGFRAKFNKNKNFNHISYMIKGNI